MAYYVVAMYDPFDIDSDSDFDDLNDLDEPPCAKCGMYIASSFCCRNLSIEERLKMTNLKNIKIKNQTFEIKEIKKNVFGDLGRQISLKKSHSNNLVYKQLLSVFMSMTLPRDIRHRIFKCVLRCQHRSFGENEECIFKSCPHCTSMHNYFVSYRKDGKKHSLEYKRLFLNF